MNLLGTYAGLVEDNKDPERLGRLKVRIPHVYGAVGGVFGAISTENLPWALPAGLPNGLSQQSGGFDWLPEIGDQVLVRFLDGEPEKPVYEWFMQTQPAAQTFKLHQYKDVAGAAVGTGGGKPKRGALVRYGHTVEWNTDGLIETTSRGYRLLLTDASAAGNDGDITLATAAGQFLEFDDGLNQCLLNVNLDWQINVGSQMIAICNSISLQTMAEEIELISGSLVSVESVGNLEGKIGGDWTMDVAGGMTWTQAGEVAIDTTSGWAMTVLLDFDLTVLQGLYVTVTGMTEITSIGGLALTTSGVLNFTSSGLTTLTGTGGLTLISPGISTLEFGRLFLGIGSTEPFVLGNQLFSYLSALHAALASHVHPDPDSGMTGPPIPVPPAPTAGMLSATISGR